jgi:hypothetical protein
MNTVLLAIIAFGSIYSVIDHIIAVIRTRQHDKRTKEALRKMREEWEDRL